MPDDLIDIPRRLHLDRRANRLIEYGAAAGAPDDLLTTQQVADWIGYSKQWLEIGRHRGYGPPFVKVGTNGRVRYRRSDVIEWLAERTHQRTSEYRRPKTVKSAGNSTSRGGFVPRVP